MCWWEGPICLVLSRIRGAARDTDPCSFMLRSVLHKKLHAISKWDMTNSGMSLFPCVRVSKPNDIMRFSPEQSA
jgi:hypothetical protein